MHADEPRHRICLVGADRLSGVSVRASSLGALELAARISGRNDTGKVDYGTEAGVFSAYGGIDSVVMGPGSMKQGHQPDEFIERSQLGRPRTLFWRRLWTICAGADGEAVRGRQSTQYCGVGLHENGQPDRIMAQADKRSYRAFISYSHRDGRWGKWLQNALEGYRIPKDMVGLETAAGKVPSKPAGRYFGIGWTCRRVHRWKAQLQEALEASENLIVICSPSFGGQRVRQ